MRPERVFFLCIVILLLCGVVFVFNASVAEAFSQFGDKFYFARKQLVWAVVSIVMFLITSAIPTSFWKKMGPIIFLIALVLTILVLIPGLGRVVQGARRWMYIGGFGFQPSELLKLGVVVYFSRWLLKHQKPLPFLALTGVMLGLLLLQPDLGTALVILGISFGIFVAAGAKYLHILGMFLFGALCLLGLIVVSPYRMERMTTFLRMENDPLGASYHIRQITIALGSGGLFGQGIGQSKQKYQYIPEASTDSIFAIAGEEIGFIGSLLVMSVFAMLFWQGYKIAEQEEDRYKKLLAVGITTWIGTQTLINLGSVVALIPLTGVPLPYISYGGTSLISILAASGILVGIGRKQK